MRGSFVLAGLLLAVLVTLASVDCSPANKRARNIATRQANATAKAATKAAPKPTKTPKTANTPRPGETPRATNTPKPTRTPEATKTPQPTPTASGPSDLRPSSAGARVVHGHQIWVELSDATGLSPDKLKFALLVAVCAALLPVTLKHPWYLACAGLFLASSDRLLTVEVMDMSLKPSYVLFSLAIFGSVTRDVFEAEPIDVKGTWSAIPWLIKAGLAGLLALHVVATLASDNVTNGLKQGVVDVVGMGVPALAVLLALNTRQKATTGVAVFVAAQVFVGVYALYEFGGHFIDAPVLVDAQVSHGLPRADGFTYEPGYYAAYVATALPLFLDDALSGTRRLRVSPAALLGFLILALIAANSRAGYLALLLVIPPTLLVRRSIKLPEVRRLGTALAGVLLVILPLAVITGFAAASFASDRISTIGDVNQGRSNAKRVTIYKNTLKIIEQKPLLGVGPGNFGSYISNRVFLPDVSESELRSYPVNNIWLQEAVDKGVLAIPFLVMVVVGVFGLLRREVNLTARMLTLGALVMLLLHGSLVSFLWDMKLWSVVALAIAVARLNPAPSPDEAPG
ncbi:MAG TPA: O-antigen ligase family protein [Dehalococcoidia bacterium]|nr:O-antigen ligase family protein [Dehalococcoidia bacterium]